MPEPSADADDWPDLLDGPDLIVRSTYYTLFDDLAMWLRRVWQSSAPQGKVEPEESPVFGIELNGGCRMKGIPGRERGILFTFRVEVVSGARTCERVEESLLPGSFEEGAG